MKEPAKKTSIEPLLVTSRVVASTLSVCTRQVQKWQDEGRIPAHKFGRRCTRYNLREVLKALGVQNDVDGGTN